MRPAAPTTTSFMPLLPMLSSTSVVIWTEPSRAAVVVSEIVQSYTRVCATDSILAHSGADRIDSTNSAGTPMLRWKCSTASPERPAPTR